MVMQEIVVHSARRQQLIDITDEVVRVTHGWTCNAVLIFVRHTTAGILINEHADPDVASDMLRALDVIVPADLPYRHAEGNSPAHIKTTLVGSSQLVPMSGGRPALGTWQGIFLAEFDGPRSRRVLVVPLTSEAVT